MIWRTINKQEDTVDIRDKEERTDTDVEEPIWHKIHSIADEASPVLASILINATNRLKENIRITRIIEGFSENKLSEIQNEINFNLYEEELRKVSDELKNIILKAGSETKIHLPPDLRSFEFEENDEINNWVKARSDSLVKQMNNSTKYSFNYSLRELNNEDIGNERKSRLLIPLLGLTLRQAKAVNNYRKNLRADDVNFDRAETLASNYASESLNYRARRLADNESMKASNHGFTSLIKAGVLANVINPREVKRRWIVVPDDRLCNSCQPMDGVEINLNEDFNTPLGIVEEPPIHQFCRCSTEIVKIR